MCISVCVYVYSEIRASFDLNSVCQLRKKYVMAGEGRGLMSHCLFCGLLLNLPHVSMTFFSHLPVCLMPLV